MNARPFSELGPTGLLWLINRVVFHPRGYALTIHMDENGEAEGWSMQGDGSEVWCFIEADDEESFNKLRDSGLLT